jgi:ElaB/YqjD/DUF883 family membrane-anchored ribosome-binding protein
MSTPDTQAPRSWFSAAAREEMLARAGVVHRRLVTFVENNPLAAVGAATAVGFVFARMLRR